MHFQDVQDDGCSGEDGCSGDSCDRDEGWSREEFDGYSDDGYDEDTRFYGFEEDAHH